MKSMDDDVISVKGLDQLLKLLNAKPPKARVGILGSSNSRKAESGKNNISTNAEIGAAHEFGTSTIPMRSFLRMPISENLDKEMSRSGLFTEDTTKEVFKQGSVIPWMEKVAICAEAVVSDAFDTGGGGKWPAWKNPGYENNTGKLLVDTQQLRKSITSEVKP